MIRFACVPIAGFFLAFAAPLLSQPQECRFVKMPDGSSVRMCKGPKGGWAPADTPVAPASPMPSVAEATYQGTFQFSEWPKSSPRQQRNLDLGGLLGSALKGSGQPGGTEFKGAITIKAKFDGAAVTAEVTGTGGIAAAHFSGLIQNGQCRLIDGRNSVIYEGNCGPDGFSGTISGTERYRLNLRGSFRTTTTAFNDISANRVRAKEAQRVNDIAAAERKKVNDTRRAQLKPLCDAGKMAACVEMDTLDH